MKDTEKSREELIRERDEARNEAQKRSAFLANMSHEIRTPIQTVTSLAELLQETSLDPEQKEYIRQLTFSGEVVSSLINDVLDFSKIESGSLELERVCFAPAETAESVVDLVTLQAHQKGLEVLVFIDPDIPEVYEGDPVRFRQIVMNLFSNAVKFTSEGEICLRMREGKGPGQIEVHVEDTGIGISAKGQKRLFQPYQQAETSTAREYGGTGLGLAISRKLVEMMGGELQVSSREGEGSDFYFGLDLSYGQEGAPPLMVPGSFEGVSVLVADDNRSARDVLGRYLRYWGCAVETSVHGEEALERVKSRAGSGSRQYDLIFVDHMMPRMGGWQFASEIHADPELRSIPLVLLSQTGRGVEEAKMKLLGWFAGYLNKPLKRRFLGELLERLFSGMGPALREGEDSGKKRALAGDLQAVGGTQPADLGFSKILVAEDHPVNQQLFRTILENWGFSVEVVSNGWECLEAVNRVQPECIFMDLHMPRMDGFEAARRIRNLGWEMPIFAVTGTSDSGERQRGRDAGMNGFLVKPFRKEDLAPLLTGRLDTGKGTPEGSAGGETTADQDAGERGEVREELEEPEELEELEETEEPEGFHVSDEPEALGGSAEPEKGVFDFEKAVEAFMGKREVVMRLLPNFMGKARRRSREMEEALDREDWETLEEAAHAVKGSAANLEAGELSEKAGRLEAAAREKAGETAALYGEFRQALERFLETAEGFLAE